MLEQRDLLVSFLNAQKNKNIIFVENDNFFTEVCTAKKAKKIIVASLMCLADNITEIKKILMNLYEQKISLISVKKNISLSNSVEMKNFISGFDWALQLKGVYSSVKIKNSLQQKKEMGIKIGRTNGSKNKKKSPCAEHHQYIFDALQKGERIATIADTVGVSVRTLFNYKKEHFSAPNIKKKRMK